MNTMPTARRGRTYYTQGSNESRGLFGVCSVVMIIGLLVAPPLILIGSERSRHTRYVALSDALDSDMVELNRLRGDAMPHLPLDARTLVHGTSERIETIPSDGEMNVSVPGALVMRRSAEYCQWQEVRYQGCETCTRTVRGSDGSSGEESYQCNCVTEYNYVKAWRSHRINSLLFDQPGAHHNPQRDPMPTRIFVDENTKLTFHEGGGDLNDEHYEDGDKNTNQHHHEHHSSTKERGNDRGGSPPIHALLDPNMLSSGVRNQPYRRVEFVPDGRAPPPSFFSRLFSFFDRFRPIRRTRFEPLRLLKDTPNSPAAIHANFVYVGQGGYFFSPQEAATSSKLFNYFAQYLEGSLFDWQVGDLMPSCKAGDVRFHYEVQDPAVVSVLGRLRRGSGGSLKIAPRTMNGIGDAAAATVGLVHAGRPGARAMLAAEDDDSRRRAHLVRGLLFLWSVPASRLAGVASRRELGDSALPVQIEGALGMFLALLGAVWLAIWGESLGALETTTTFFLGGALGCLAYGSARRRGAGRRWHAAWCRVGRWANVPPGWRVEDSYAPPTAKASDGIDGARSKSL